MYTEIVQFTDAVLTAIHHKIEDDKVQTRISVTGTLVPEIATHLGCRDLVFAKNGTPKGGFSTLQLDTGCAAYRALFEHQDLKQTFELNTGDSTDRYVVERAADGILKLKFRLNYHGDPHEALAYVMAIGSAESRLKIVPLQTEMKSAAVEENEQPRQRSVDEYLSDEPVVVPAETVRSAMNRRNARKQAGV